MKVAVYTKKCEVAVWGINMKNWEPSPAKERAAQQTGHPPKLCSASCWAIL